MPSLIETFIAGEIHSSIDVSGKCTHACSADKPFQLGEVEANDLHKFDPDALSALKKFGVTIEKISIQDIDEVGQKISLLKNLIREHGRGQNEFLYKYAMSYRRRQPLLISKDDPYYKVHIECRKKFKNPMKEFP